MTSLIFKSGLNSCLPFVKIVWTSCKPWESLSQMFKQGNAVYEGIHPHNLVREPSRKREPVVSVWREPPEWCPSSSLLLENSKTVSFAVSFPGSAAATYSDLVAVTAETRLEYPRSLRISGPLLTDGIVRILPIVELCRPVLREVLGLGRSVGRAAVVVGSVKLVHQRIESGEAHTFFWPSLPVSDPR